MGMKFDLKLQQKKKITLKKFLHKSNRQTQCSNAQQVL